MRNVKSIVKKENQLSKFDYAVYKQAFDMFAGKAMPNAEDLAGPVLGAILLDFSALGKIKSFLLPKHFYNSTHQDIFSGILEMDEKNMTIDILTVTEYFKGKRTTYLKSIDSRHKKYTGSLLEKIGGPYTLVELTNMVASAANIEAHARYIQDKYLQRELIQISLNSIKEVYNLETFEIYNYRNNLAEELKVSAINDYFQIETINQSIINAESEPETQQMIGSLWMSKQMVVMFADSGMGKSVLAFQMAESLASGTDLFRDMVPNHCMPQKTLLIDFEYSNKQVQKRYSNEELKKSYQFHDNFFRATVNADFEDYQSNMEKFIIQKIEEAVINTKAESLIIDNMSFIMDEATDNSVAIKFMKAMKRIKKKYNVSILILGHVPKRDKTRAFTKDDLAGAKALSNFLDGMFAIGEDANDNTIKYIIQLKSRDGENSYNSDNVIKTVIEKDSDMFLRHNIIGFGREDDMLLKVYDDEAENNMIDEALKMRREEKTSYRELAKYFNNRWSPKTIERKVKKYLEEKDISGLDHPDK